MLNFRFLGALEISGGDIQSAAAVVAQPKRAALLAYLALHAPGEFHRRDALLALFWPEADELHARRALNQALYFLRGALGQELIVTRGADDVRLDPSQFVCDVLCLRQHLADDQLEQALATYRGELLPAFHADASSEFEEWLDAHRRSLAESAMGAALTLSSRAETDGSIAAATHWARCACELAPLDETCAQQLLRLLMVSGNAAAAVAQYERLADRLRRELDVEPCQKTRALIVSNAAVSAVAGTAPETPVAPVPPVLVERTPAAERHRAPRATLTAMITLLVGLVAFTVRERVLVGALPVPHRTGARPTILVADFAGPATDTALGDVATQLAVSGLQDSRAARVVWSGELGPALERMGMPVTTPARGRIARELAVREGFGAVLEGSVREAQGTLFVGLTLVDPANDLVLFTRTANASGAPALIGAMDGLMRETRKRIGDASDSIAAAKPLEQVTTPSLEALREYTEATRLSAAYLDVNRAIALLEHAVTLDTTFAAAYRKLGVHLYWHGESQRSSEMLRKAVRHADRLGDAERELATATLYSRGRYFDAERSLAAFEAVLARDSTDAIALENKAWLLEVQREYARAERMVEAALADTTRVIGYRALAGLRLAQGNTAGAWWALDQGIRLGERANFALLRAQAYEVSGRLDSAEAELRVLADGPHRYDRATDEGDVAEMRSSIARRMGRLADAHRYDADRLRLAQARRSIRSEVWVRFARLHEAAWILHQPATALAIIPELRRLSESVSGIDRPIPRLAIAYAEAGQSAAGAALLREYQRGIAPGEWADFTQDCHRAWGYVALAEGRPADAVREFRVADKGSCWACILPILSFAYESAGQLDSAIAVGERYLSASDFRIARTDGMERPLLEHRLGRLYLQRGDKVNAARHLESFVRMWAHADAELRPQVDSARRELALARK